MKFKNIKNWSSEKISQRVFYLLVGVSVLVFALFFFVGYDMPFEENPDFNAPLFTNLLLGLMVVLLVAAFVLAIVSVVNGYRKTLRGETMQNGIPENKIFRFTWLGTLLLLILTFLLGSSTPLSVNGEEFNDWTWLKASDMFVYTSIILLVLAVASVIFGATRYIRKKQHKAL